MQVVIAEHHIALFRQGGKRGVIRLKSGAENDGGFFVYECGQLGFQLDMHIERAVQQARSAAAAAILLQRVDAPLP